ncbi:uncharacterized protein IL334_004981 [Kwoniella shivajii]|uniref:Uncharacterized protein n=1 Tax=Kwoniella shivajii TaxID=564305 RepID=A0ABZ1D1V6_9TREE|nr:hypothetical protein IL334_004981 [Kwoniella shivajii]
MGEPSMLSDNETEQALSNLSEVLAQLEDRPDNILLIRRQILLMHKLGMTSEVIDAYSKMSSLIMLDEVTWLAYLDLCKVTMVQPITLDSLVEMLEKFDHAENDYFCLMPLNGFTSCSMIAWERHTWTSSAYSTFCSSHSPEEYESRMIYVTEIAGVSKQKLSEKRYGKTRADFEERYISSNDLATQIQVLIEYAGWESDSRARASGRGTGPKADHALTQVAYERAVAKYASATAFSQSGFEAAEECLRNRPKDSVRGKGKQKQRDEQIEDDQLDEQIRMADEAIRAYKDAEAGVWVKYGDWAIVAEQGTKWIADRASHVDFREIFVSWPINDTGGKDCGFSRCVQM